jgi:hypothetical protein
MSDATDDEVESSFAAEPKSFEIIDVDMAVPVENALMVFTALSPQSVGVRLRARL